MWQKTILRLRYYLQYFPFTVNALLLGLGLIWAASLLWPQTDPANTTETQSYRPLVGLMAKTAFYFLIILLLLSILSTLFCWLRYLWLKHKKQYQIDFEFKHQAEKNRFWFETVLKKARRPILGFVKARLVYDNGQMTDKFVLASNKRPAQKF